LPRPDAILLNGGVFNSARTAERLQQAVSAWWPSAPLIPLLEHDSLELAVARGAAYYGLVRRGMGSRIGGGTAHAFYLGLATQTEDGSPMAVCLIPRGHEEGEPVELTSRPFQLTLGQPVQFPLYTTTADRIDAIGEIVKIGEDMHPLPPIHTLLQGAQGKTEKRPVHIRATLTEIGTLELWCVSESGERWRLEFELRGTATDPKCYVTESMPARFADARDQIDRFYGRKPVKGSGAPGPKEIKQLWNQLEYALGPRENWRLPVLRELWSTLYSGAPRRRRSEDHEKLFFQLAGYTLRPGFGYPLDEWRCEQIFALFGERVHHHKVKPIWNEFWIFWRRIAGGLNPERQQEIWQYLEPFLARRIPPRPAKAPVKMKGIQPEGLDEMVRAAAALEHLSPQQKSELGDWILDRIRQPGTPSGGPWTWSLGRLGARVPIYGSSHNTVSPDQVEAWLTRLLEWDIHQIDGAPFAAVQLARLTGDRTRDVSEPIRSQTDQALRNARIPDSWRRLLHEVIELEATDKARALGDTLPVGLHLA
jgi:hypothetical protein